MLLRGVNDDVEALADLSERGFAAGVLPYYLHQLDRVAGAAHFEVADERGPRAARARWPRACRATWCRGWCAKSPAIRARRPL